MKYFCPNESCQNHKNPEKRFYIKKGVFKTKHNHQPVPRFQCKACGKKFSSNTFKDTKNQKKPYLNKKIFELYASGTTQRRLAKVLGCNRKTVVRKFLFLADKAKNIHQEKLDRGEIETSYVQFDEMESFEKTRLKPLSIAIAVRPKTGEIVSVDVAEMKAKGRIASDSVAKYGVREDKREAARLRVVDDISKCLKQGGTILTDSLRSYNKLFDSIPDCKVEKYNSGKNKTEQGFDKMFALNHVAAVLRNDLSRLMRKTWTTTQKKERLLAHLQLYIAYRNGYDVAKPIRCSIPE